LKPFLIPLFFLFLFSCKREINTIDIPIKEMSDSEYPDNPNLESRHSKAQQKYFSQITLKENNTNLFDIELHSNEKGLCNIALRYLPLIEMMPTAAEFIKKDDYLSYLGIINQEWNRQQVQFNKDQYEVTGHSTLKITRVDLARNCLNAYLWELLVYAEDNDGESKLFWQGWFDFPKDTYKKLFELRNKLDYEKYRPALEHWIDAESKKIDLSLLRREIDKTEVNYVVKNDELYPLKGERKRKAKNIITPSKISKINDLLSDSTIFATFSIPGFYNRSDPRKTELSRFGVLYKVTKSNIINGLGKSAIELRLDFRSNTDSSTLMSMIIGGIDFKEIPKLKTSEANEGWQTSMGIANHSFYETYEYQQKHLTKDNGFYALLLDENGKYIDSHKVGIDGPLFHFDVGNENLLHLWVLAFERHAFVGHYLIDMKSNKTLLFK
jgi:hypothetical protein